MVSPVFAYQINGFVGCFRLPLVFNFKEDGNVLVNKLKDFLQGVVRSLVFLFSLVALRLVVVRCELKRHLLFECWERFDRNFANFPWVSAKSFEIRVVTNNQLTVLSHPHIHFEHLTAILECIREGLSCVFRLLPTAASVCDEDLRVASSWQWDFKLTSFLVKERGSHHVQVVKN